MPKASSALDLDSVFHEVRNVEEIVRRVRAADSTAWKKEIIL